MTVDHVPVVILAGGFGTRLRHVVQDVPKPMAPINGRPFLEILLDYLIEEGIREVILATGHQAEVISAHFGQAYRSLNIRYSHEEKPLGTGGAIKQAFDFYNLDEALVLNGDTFFPVSLSRFYYFHMHFQSEITVGVKYIQKFERYGTIKWNAFNEIEAFYEKVPQEEGWINGGIYCVNKSAFTLHDCCSNSFSFEVDILEKNVDDGKYFAIPFSNYFIDIGIPEDYYSFQDKNASAAVEKKNKNRTLFIDRDGVINRRLPGDYVRHPDQFQFLPGVIDSMIRLSEVFSKIIIVTNQQGIGKGLMSMEDLDRVHSFMLTSLKDHGVSVDAVYAAPQLAIESSMDRKPNIGMALKAKDNFPDIDWSSCILVGDSTSDIEFGLRMGMVTVLVGDKSDSELAHYYFADLPDLINHLHHIPALNDDGSSMDL